MKSKSVLILGGGNMGLAYASCLLKEKLCSPHSLSVVEMRTARRAELRRSIRCCILAAVPESIPASSVVILAVKPQDMLSACEELSSRLSKGALVVSVMAGIEVGSIQKALGGKVAVVRCMPNLAAKIGMGTTVAYLPRSLSPSQRNISRQVLGSTGSMVEVSREALINQATAISGSGPAYVFYLIEHLIGVAIELGFTRPQAEQLVSDTLMGSAALWRASGEDPRVLRERVTSKNGTTYAAVKVFERGKMGETLRNGVKAANRRAKELARFAKKGT